jgi:predicted ATPase
MALKRLILEKTEGTPFFMEEVVQTLVEEGVLAGDRGQYRLERTSTALHIPPTVHGVLAARIDRLAAEEKALLQQLSVIGREFPLSLVSKVVPYSEDQLYRLLTALQRKEFLYEQPAFPEVEYLFKHALTQEVAYNSLLIERRKMLHERTAQALEALYSVSLDEHYSALAHHYSRSGNTQKAVEYLGLAGQQAVQRSANTEAITHLTTALELLKTLPDTPERDQHELTLQTTLGPALMATKGYAASEVEKTYTRARDLCQHVGETPQLWPVLFGLWAFHRAGGQHQTARELAEQHLHLAQTLHDPAPRLEAHLTLADSCLCLGEFVLARAHAEQGIGLYDPQHHRALAFRYGQDIRAHGLVKAALVLWYLGYVDQARTTMEEALALAQELSHPNTSAMVLDHAAFLHQLRREEHATQERAEAVIALCNEHGFLLWLAQGTILWGWALAEQGQGEEGIKQIHQGLATCRARGNEGDLGYFLALLAKAYQKVGQREEGLNVVAEALTVIDRTGEHQHEAELHRLKGELLLAQEGSRLQAVGCREKTEEAQECFWKAIEFAREQQAKSLELRAVMSLSRLWHSQSKKKEAHAMLAEIYDWFTEGFDTRDLQDAKRLIEELV